MMKLLLLIILGTIIWYCITYERKDYPRCGANVFMKTENRTYFCEGKIGHDGKHYAQGEMNDGRGSYAW